MKDDTAQSQPYHYVPDEPVETLERRVEAHHRDTTATLALITAALARIERAIEHGALVREDMNARIDRFEINELETRRQVAALQPKKKATRKK